MLLNSPKSISSRPRGENVNPNSPMMRRAGGEKEVEANLFSPKQGRLGGAARR